MLKKIIIDTDPGVEAAAERLPRPGPAGAR
jgi:hypothetical protein